MAVHTKYSGRYKQNAQGVLTITGVNNLVWNNPFKGSFARGGYPFVSKITKILSTGSRTKGLNVALYLLEQKKFLCCNNAFKMIAGTKVDMLFERGWDFWFANICPEESLMVKNRLQNYFSVPFDRKAITLRYHIYDAAENLMCVRHDIVLHQLENCIMAINYFFDVSEKERIENCLGGKKRNSLVNESNGIKCISPREEEVLRLIADGYSSKQIANLLFISNHTAISHRKHLIEKFRVKNTAQLIKKASKIIEL